MKRTTVVSVGLFVTWALHDFEELLTMSRSSREILSGLPDAVPIPETLRQEGLSPGHVAIAIAAMGVVLATAAVLGVRSAGRSVVFRGVLLGFGLHGFAHVAMALAAAQYVSGVLTSPIIVIPYWLWARRQLVREGIATVDRMAVAVAVAGLLLLQGIHALVYLLLGQ